MMTLEEAKYCLKQTSCRSCEKYDECLKNDNLARCFEASAIGAKAIDKQISKKPVETGWLYCECGLPLLMATVSDGRRYEYCPICGQKIDWSGEYDD